MNSFLDSKSAQSALLYLGAASASYLLLHAAIFVYSLIRPSKLPRFLRGEHKAWALVTGASDGIGFGFCQELAGKGFNVILHGRNRAKLESQSAKLIKGFPGTGTRIYVSDATKQLPFDHLLELVKDIRLTVLVNNVGGSQNLAIPFIYHEDRTDADIDEQIHLNINFTTKITRALLPALTKNQPSLIMNIGSLAALGVPKMTVYSGCKAYLLAFSRTLQTDLALQGKDVTVHYTFVANTQSDENRLDLSLFIPTSRGLAAAALRRVGGPVAMTPYRPHSVLKFFIEGVPEWLTVPVMKPAIAQTEKNWMKYR
ncbi:MAG: hypothetical protein LQ340_007450 [Diploschistes diacapsis]|nr:MAG: hypothetical protein LQ340_007450 [Diploschistes diacapsis]